MGFVAANLRLVLVSLMSLSQGDSARDSRAFGTYNSAGTSRFQRWGIARPRLAVAALIRTAPRADCSASKKPPKSSRRSGLVQGRDQRLRPFPRTQCSCGFPGEFDGVIACYHDQAMIPLSAFPSEAVNVTLGLPFIRTSVDHGRRSI